MLFGFVTIASPLRAPDAQAQETPSAHCAQMAEKAQSNSKASHKMASCCAGACHCPLSQTPGMPAPMHATALPAVPMQALQFAELAVPAGRGVTRLERPPRS
jgi:hypothetical protein